MTHQRRHTFRLGEFFCGPGGLALGAQRADVQSGEKHWTMKHVWATDSDHDSCETYRRNICPRTPASVVCEDIRKLDFGILKDISDIDAFSFGFPCNDFSVVGERKGMNGVYGPLYAYGVQAIRFFQPAFFVAENVGGLRNSHDGKVFARIVNELFDAGYSVYPNLYRFDQYGVPQTRQRLIIVGIRKNIDAVFRIPSPKPFAKIDVTCKTALESPPITNDASNHEITKQSETVIDRLRHIKPGENAFTANIPNHLQLNVLGAKISQIYKRLDPDTPAYTVTGSGGGGTHMYHWKENRALTNRERARLQTFPDNFIFSGSKESVRKQIGMAVPCAGAQVIFETILKSLADIAYDSIAPNIEPLIQPIHMETYNITADGHPKLCQHQTEYMTAT